MVKVVQPLFTDEATGTIGGLLQFRRTAGGIIAGKEKGPDKKRLQQRPINACFAQAKAEHSAIPPTWVNLGGSRWGYRIIPTWPEFWNQWLIDHPECIPQPPQEPAPYLLLEDDGRILLEDDGGILPEA